MRKFLIPILFLVGCSSPSPRSPAGFSNPTLWNPISGAASSGLYQGPFEVNPSGAKRPKAKVYLPNQYEDKSEWPLKVLLHGFSGTGESEDSYLTVRHRVSHKGFILVTPEGTILPKGTKTPAGAKL